MFLLYNLFGLLILIIYPLIFFIRFLNSKEDLNRFFEKISIYKGINSKKTLWIHAVSVGEVLSVIPLIKEFEKDIKVKQILVTTSTKSSALILSKYKFSKVIHKYLPIDVNFITKRFINYWKPYLAIFIESEIWPNFYFNLKKKDIPIILLNARITSKSFNRWRKLSIFSSDIFSKINLALSQNKETIKYLKNLGTKKIKFFGNLKFYREKRNLNINSKLFNSFKNKKIWCSVSTHSPEEIKIGKIHKNFKFSKKNILTIVIPRHIERSESIINEFENMGLNTQRHSANKKVSKKIDIYVVDTYGDTEKFCSFSNIVFMGGSFINHGGQNPLEAVRLGNKILHGPNIDNFKEVYKILKQNRISKKVITNNDLGNYILKKINHKKNKEVNKKINLLGRKIFKKYLDEIRNYI